VFSWTGEAGPGQKGQVATELRGLRPLMNGVRAYHAGADAALVPGHTGFAMVDFEAVQS
jgi:hypothetical protein